MALSIVIGVAIRMSGIIADDLRVVQQFPSEDGYFMLTIARNIALGHGFSIAGGEMPTNGTQPLTTLIWSLAFSLAGGERAWGVRLTLIFEMLISCGAAYMVYRLARRVLAQRPDAHAIGMVAASIWFASPIGVRHSMNTLETGFNALVALTVAFLFIEPGGPSHRARSLAKCLPVGFVLGLAFWARNDSIFLILAACLTYLIGGFAFGLAPTVERFGRTIVFGLTSIVVASPWLAFNYFEFGHIMPISGRAEALTRQMGANIADLPPVLLEYMLGLFPIPERLEIMPVTVALCAVAVLGILFIAGPRIWRAASKTERTLFLFVSIYGGGLSTFYGLEFGAGWFMSRYLFPLGGFFTIALAATLLSNRKRLGMMLPVAATAFVAGSAAANYRTFTRGTSHPHHQVAKWANANIPPQMWLGAVQTGTLGFFHDRTLNLDGKVNVEAYEALTNQRRGDYIQNGPIEALVDWSGTVHLLESPIMDANFRILVHDTDENLAVIERKVRRRFDERLEVSGYLRMIVRGRLLAALERKDLGGDARTTMLTHLAMIYRFDRAPAPLMYETIDAAIASLSSGSDPRVVARSYRLRGDVHRIKLEYAKGRADYKKAIAALEPYPDQHATLSDLWHGVAETFRLERNLEAAKGALNEASAFERTPRERVSTALALADLLRDAADGTGAQKHYERALSIAKTMPSTERNDRVRALTETRLARLLWHTDVERSRKLVIAGVERRKSRAPLGGVAHPPLEDTLALAAGILTSTTSTTAR